MRFSHLSVSVCVCVCYVCVCYVCVCVCVMCVCVMRVCVCSCANLLFAEQTNSVPELLLLYRG